MKLAVIGTGILGPGSGLRAVEGPRRRAVRARRPRRADTRTWSSTWSRVGRSGWTLSSSSTTRRPTRTSSDFFRELGVRTQPSEMSFLGRLRTARPRVLGSVRRHAADARDRPLPAPRAGRARRPPRRLSLARYVAEEGYSPRFRSLPRTDLRALRSTALPDARLPARLRRPLLREPRAAAFSAPAGRRSPAAARATCARSRSAAHQPLDRGPLDPPRRRRHRAAARGRRARRFEGVVVATHADQALRLLEDPSEDERRLLRVFGTTENDTVLHTDARFLPRRVATRGSWNYQLRDCGCDDGHRR